MSISALASALESASEYNYSLLPTQSPLKLKVSSIYFCQTRYFQQSRNL